MAILSESVIEDAALDWFRGLGYDVMSGPGMPPGPDALRKTHEDVTLLSAVRGALARINSGLPEEALDDAFRKLTRPEGATLESPQPRLPPHDRGRRERGVP